MKPSTRRITCLLLCLNMLLSSCGLLTRPVQESGWVNWDGDGGWTGTESSGAFRSDSGSEPILALSESGAAPSLDEEAAPSAGSPEGQGPNLRAGSVDDNAEWDDYLLYRLQFASWGLPVHDLDVTERHDIYVRNAVNLPVLGAVIRISDLQGRHITELRTTSEGRALFFPALYDLAPDEDVQVTIEGGNLQTEAVLLRTERRHIFYLDVPAGAAPVQLDVHFLIDATGSMADEIQQLKENMIAIAEQIAAMPSQPDVRFGMTVYRDRGDLFVSRTFDFTPDVDRFVDELASIAADGGGDYPESLNEGLHDALRLPEWRGEDTISLVFLIADAPPHLDYANDFDYAEEILFANQEGIKVYPLASSGLDDQGEYIFRQIAQVTGARFLFLTYGAGGAPGDETTHHVDDYSVLSLDQLVLRLIEEELGHLSTAVQ